MASEVMPLRYCGFSVSPAWCNASWTTNIAARSSESLENSGQIKVDLAPTLV